MKSLNQILENIIWTPDGVDEEKTNTGKRMPSAMKKRVDLLRQELADNGIELGKISSAYRDAYNQGRVMYANWFSKGSNKYRSGESVEDTLKKRKRYLVGLYNDRKAKAVHELYAEGYRKGNDGKGGILPDILGDTLLKVEEYLKKNPISNHQGNRAIDVGPNSKLKNFINSGKSKIAQSVLDEGNHLHIKLRAYDGSDDNTVSSSSGGTQVSDKVSRSEIKNIQRILKNAGYDLGAYGPNKDGVDGYYGKLTKKALENWKSKHGMQANTVLDRDVYNEVISKQGELVDTSLEVDRQTKIENRVNLTTKLPEILPGKSIKIDNLNISKDSNYEIKSALVENLNSFKSIGDILNEDSKLKDLIRKVRNIKKKADTALAFI